jgi:hypothetical protein
MYGEYAFSGLASNYRAVNVYALRVFALLSLTITLSLLMYHKIELPARWNLNRLLAG